MKRIPESRFPSLMLSLASCALLGSCAINHPGDTVLAAFVDGGGNELDLIGDQEGVFFVHRGGFWLTGSKWKWEDADQFTFTLSNDGRKAVVKITDATSAIGVRQNGFVREYDPQGQPTMFKGQQLAAEFIVNWSPKKP